MNQTEEIIMETSRNKRCHAVFMSIITVGLLFLMIMGCNSGSSGGGSDGSNDTNGTQTPEPGNVPLLAETMILVLDSEGDPVENALVDDKHLSDSNGVVLGDLPSFDSGWMSIAATGYARGFARPQGTLGAKLAVATLSPFQTSILLDGSADLQLKSGNPDQPDITVMLDADLFTAENIAVHLAAIDPLTTGPLFAPLDSGADLYLQSAFALYAHDLMDIQATLRDGKTVTVTFRDAGSFSDAAQIAYFDVMTGLWQVIPNSLSRLDAEHVQCILPHFSTFGFFDDQQPIYLDFDPETPDSWFEAWARLNHIFIAAEKNGTVPDEKVVEDAVEDLAKAAKDYAKTHRNETGKNLLMQAYEKAALTGNKKIAEDLKTEAQDLTQELGEKLLKDPGCGKISELLALATQAQLLGGFESLLERLNQKIKDLRNTCGVWKGSIHYWFFMDDPYPWPDYDEWGYESGAKDWHEFHTVTIAVHENGLVDGECHVKNKMPTTRYRKERATDCGMAYTDLVVKTFPSTGQCALDFEGTYANGIFTIGPVGILATQFIENKPIAMNFRTEIHEYFGDECQVFEEEHEWKFADYYSQLIHGFLGAPQPPSIEEMLNTGVHSVSDGREIIRGFDMLSFTVGENTTPVLPISKASLSWTFTKVNNQPGTSP
jgi:hypothetical protein